MATQIHGFGPNGELSPGAEAALEGLGGGGATALGDLTDVDTTAATTGQVLTFDGSEWSPDAPSAGTVTSTSISDSTATGRAVLTAADAATARSAIGAGTSNLALGTTGSTAAAGNDSRIVNAVPSSRTINAKPLTDNIALDADDVGARPDDWLPGVSEDSGNLLTLGTDDLAMLDPGDLPAAGGGGGVPIFETLAEAEAYEATHPGKVALHLGGEAPPDPEGPEPVFRAFGTGPGNLATTLLSGVPIGAPSAGRTVIVVVNAFSSSDRTITVTLDGQPMTLDYRPVTALGHRHQIGFFSLPWTVGTAAAVEVTWNTAPGSLISIFVYTSAVALTPSSTARHYTHVEDDTIPLTISIPSGSYPIAVAGTRGDGLVAPDEWTWTGADEDAQTASATAAQPTGTSISASIPDPERLGIASLAYEPA